MLFSKTIAAKYGNAGYVWSDCWAARHIEIVNDLQSGMLRIDC